MKATIEAAESVQNHSTYDVIISGAGPVGLFLACELSLAKCSVLILEKAVDPSSLLKRLPFGIRGLSTPGVEALYRRGLLKELEVPKRIKDPFGNSKAEPVSQARLPAGHFAGIPFRSNNIDSAQWRYRLSSSTETNLISEMEELEMVLARRAETLGVDIKRGVAVTSFHQTGAYVTVQSGGQSFKGKWLVGCDGSRSAVRKIGGFEFAGTDPEFTGYSAKVDIANPEKLKAGRNLTPKGLYFQSQPGYVVMQEFDGGAFHNAGEPVTREHIQDVLRRISNTDVTIDALHAGATWTDRARQATAYRIGQVLLAGDAAHIHAPLGGQGLNLGLGDAMNLGWKLAATVHGKAPEGLLDSYFTERYPIGAQVLDWSRAQVAIMKPDPHARALHAIVRDLMDTRDGATYMAGRVWGIYTHYNLDGDHPLIGRSVPNFESEGGTRLGELMNDGKAILLDFVMNSSLRTLTDEYGDQMKYVSGRAKEQLGLSAALIRPDGFVAWASDKAPDDQSIRQAASRWFVPEL